MREIRDLVGKSLIQISIHIPVPPYPPLPKLSSLSSESEYPNIDIK